MEGDAGTSRLNPTDALDSSPTKVTAEDSPESEAGTTDQDGTEVTADAVPTDASEFAGADQASLVDVDSAPLTDVAPQPSDDAGSESSPAERGGSRLGRGWLIGISAALFVLAGGIGAGGYLALRSAQAGMAIERNDAAAIQAAKDCVSATQAPDPSAVAESVRKIIECSTGDFGSQAALYSNLLVDAYQAANVHVQVSEIRAAVERNNDDGSVDVLVALRVKVSNVELDNQETGYRLRVRMAPEEGQYKITKLDQVAK